MMRGDGSEGQLKRRSLIIPWWIFQWALQSDSFRRYVVVETAEGVLLLLPSGFREFRFRFRQKQAVYSQS